MADEINDVFDGIKRALESIPDLRVYAEEAEGHNNMSVDVAILKYAGSSHLAIGGSSFMAQVTIQLVMHPQPRAQAMRAMRGLLSPLGNRSIESALESDRTLGGKVDTLRLVTDARDNGAEWSSEFRFYPTGSLYTTDVNVEVVKQVTT